MSIFKKIIQWLTGRKKCYYLHITYKAQFSETEWLESDKFFTLQNISVQELRGSIQKMIENENGKKVVSLMLVNITELPKGLFDMLTKSVRFEDIKKED